MEAIKFIIDWIVKYCETHNINTLIIGISGGIDSAVTSTLCAETGINTIVVSLPIYQKEKELHRALKHQKWLLKRFQNDAAEVRQGQECGVRPNNFVEFEIGDMIEAYQINKIAQSL